MPTPMQPYPDLGKYCSYAQAIYSETALRHGLTENTPTDAQYQNMLLVYQHVIDPVCRWLGMPVGINSFYRSGVPQKKIKGVWQSVNSIVGGSKTSDHPNGRAVDLSLRWVKTKKTNIDLAAFARDHLDLDQLIIERVDPLTGRPAWVHLSYKSPSENRHQALEAKFDATGKPDYVRA